MKPYQAKLRTPLAAALLIASLIWIWYSRTPDDLASPKSIQAAQIGFTAPDFSLSGMDGGEYQLSDYAGEPVILNFWASWCPPCKAEMPAFQSAFEEYSSSDLNILAINATNQDSITDVSAFIQQYGITFPVLLDQSGAVSRDYLIHSLPTTFFIDKDGVILDIIIGGPIPLSMLRIQASRLLGDQ